MFGFVSKKKYDQLQADFWAVVRDSVEEQSILEEALEEIVANETEGANATVKRMARIARAALAEVQGLTPEGTTDNGGTKE